MPFNKEQDKAIRSPLGKNVIISAGAGSGKTKTLSEKVYKICTDDKIKTSDLLVLTFTNKAAFEMKERIVKRFKEASSPLADEILSSHIQTFDSFSLYLVKQYGQRLGIPSTISIIDDDVLEGMRNELLDDILLERYKNKDEEFISLLSRYNTFMDTRTKKVILDLEYKLSCLLPDTRKEFIKDCKSKFVSDSFLEGLKKEYLQSLRDRLVREMRKAIFVFENFDNNQEEIISNIVNMKDDSPVLSYSFNDENIDPVFDICKMLLNTGDVDLYDTVRVNKDDLLEALDGRKHRTSDKKAGTVLSILRSALKEKTGEKTGFLVSVLNIGSLDKQIEFVKSSSKDVTILLDIVDELDRRLVERKFVSNSYSFQDISNMALSLLIDPKYKEEGDKIRNRFKYILVDEYQDTNDLQEAFLNSFADSTIFTVGDAKQAIYGFRNSNCQLFLDRKERYEKDETGRSVVIEMNKNYRSVVPILDDINKIFVNYMSLEHGGISYKGQEMLHFDEDVDLFDRNRCETERDKYGIQILEGIGSPMISSPVKRECLAIIADIKKKIESEYEVLDFGQDGKITHRKCRYSDFAILIGKRRNFADYQKLFLDAGIPLNNEIKTSFGQIDCILVIQSLLQLVDKFIRNDMTGLDPLYCSVARSYIFGINEGYKDSVIFSRVKAKTVLDDPLMTRLKDFVDEEKNNKISVLFLDVLKEFKVLEKLVYLGDVSNNTSKIESLYSLVKAKENEGANIHDFVEMFNTFNKYGIDATASSITSIDDAVNLMTIHQSKGLEFKIVYLPYSDNNLSSASALKGADYVFSRNMGILLPNYSYEGNVKSFLNDIYRRTEGSKNSEISEHVRLFYVALTRAKETLYIVGERGKRKTETLFDMLDTTAHHLSIDKNVLDNCAADKKSQEYIDYERMISSHISLFERRRDILSRRRSDDLDMTDELFDLLVLNKSEQLLQESIDILLTSIFPSLLETIASDNEKKGDFFSLYYLGMRREQVLSSVKSEKEVPIPLSGSLYEHDRDEFFQTVSSYEYGDIFSRYSNIRKTKIKKKTKDENKEVDMSREMFEYAYKACFKDDRKIVDVVYPWFRKNEIEIKENAKKGRKVKLPNLKVDENSIEYSKTSRRRASLPVPDDDSVLSEVLERGTKLHACLEIVDLKTKDTSFIKDKKDRYLIDKVLSLPTFNIPEGGKVYREYSYHDEELRSDGSIDMLVVSPDCIKIVDYKLSDADEEKYRSQLETYRRNIERIFSRKDIELYLVSIAKGTCQKL